MPVRIGLRGVAGLIVVLLAVLAGSGSVRAAFPGTNGKIAFASLRDGDWEVYVMNADGTGQLNLTNYPTARDDVPAWSPDGTRIAFAGTRLAGQDIIVMQADGTGVTPLAGSGTDSFPAWSPDGSRIAFTSDRNGSEEIYVMDADGTNQVNLTNTAPGNDTEPAWSPDGTKIAFRSDRDGNNELYVMNTDGTGQTRHTFTATDELGPEWSPDGSKIAFSFGPFPSRDIYVMNPDGTGVVNVTNTATNFDGDPAWSPDGTKIAFVSQRDAENIDDIYVANADGTGEVRLTTADPINRSPSWQPLPGPPPSETGEIIVDKVTDPTGDPQSFDFTLNGGPSSSSQSFSLTDASTPHNSGPLAPGAGYVVTESVPTGWRRVTATCSDGSSPSSIDLSPGEVVTCTFTNRHIAVTYAPLVYLHSDESAFPDSTNSYLAGSELWWSHDRGCADHRIPGAIDERRLGVTSSSPYMHEQNLLRRQARGRCEHGAQSFAAFELTRPNDASPSKVTRRNEGFFVDFAGDQRITENNGASSPLADDVVYYEYVERQYLIYWFFYPYNARGFQHESDWEHITVKLNSDDEAEAVAFYQHECPAEAIPWAELKARDGVSSGLYDGTHPIVYSSLGSHASYDDSGKNGRQRPRVDCAPIGDRTDIGYTWKTWRSPINARGQVWYGFGGAWGFSTASRRTTGGLGPSSYRLPDAVPPDWR